MKRTPMKTERLIKISKRWAISNIVAASMMFLILVSLFFAARVEMIDNWKKASKAQEIMNKFEPTTEIDKTMKRIILDFSYAIKGQRDEFFLLVPVVLAFGYFGVWSFIIIRKLLAELARRGNTTTKDSISTKEDKK